MSNVYCIECGKQISGVRCTCVFSAIQEVKAVVQSGPLIKPTSWADLYYQLTNKELK